MKLNQLLLGNGKNLPRKRFFWNMAGSTVMSLSTLLLTMIVTRVTGEITAGIFVYAFTLAQQLQSVGYYEVRPYQSTDLQETYSFSTYLSARIVTCTAMMVICLVIIAFRENSLYNNLVIFLVCFYKMFDTAEDVYHGLFQQQGRLDVAGKAMFFRVLTSTLAFLAALYLTKDLVVTTTIAIAVAAVGFLLFDVLVSRQFVKEKYSFQFIPLRRLLITCFPLFIGAFLLLYIYNAPKYALSDYMPPEYLTYFNALFILTYIINLFSGFVLKPILNTLADSWLNREFKRFSGIILKLSLALVGFTVLVIAAGYFMGLPVLSWLYSLDLSPYRTELIVLLAGGGLSAISVVLYYAATVMRKQKWTLFIYIAVSVAAMIVSPMAVQKMGLLGASLIYLALMVFMTLLFICMNAYFIHKVKQEAG